MLRLPKPVLPIALLLLTLLPALSAAGELVYSFNGTVLNVIDPDGDAPAVVAGDAVDVTVAYESLDAFVANSSANWNLYGFPAASMFIKIVINGLVFELTSAQGSATTLVQMASTNHILRSDILATGLPAGSNFASQYAGGTHLLRAELSDSLTPLDMLSSISLPAVPSDVMFGSANIAQASVRADSADGTRQWIINCTLDRLGASLTENPVAVEATSFSRVKSLYHD